jgi:hypothetical protein
MVSFFRATKFGGALVTAALMLAGVSTPSQAQTGTVYLKIVKVAFIVGGGGGSGVLIYQGHRYPLRVSGIGIGSIGIAEAKMSGIAYNLHRPSDITGTYSAAGAGLAVVGGGQVAQLQNEHGVLLKLQGVQLGFQATLGVGGMTISMR